MACTFIVKNLGSAISVVPSSLPFLHSFHNSTNHSFLLTYIECVALLWLLANASQDRTVRLLGTIFCRELIHS